MFITLYIFFKNLKIHCFRIHKLLLNISEELKKRERQRRNKKREDKKTSRRMQEVERRQMGMGEPSTGPLRHHLRMPILGYTYSSIVIAWFGLGQ